ncbi:hypothetical protein [Azospirillum sp. ST 5-10]|uniref:hypothetical protein n=1 Tax=unclassified Azospirillum TaxID=2630922 RepID=UPI003F49BC39
MDSTSVRPAVHRRQFVLARTPVDRPDWRHAEVGDGWVLSHCPTLPVQPVVGDRRRPAWLLGHALSCDSAAPAPAEALRRCTTVDATLHERWFGRWVLIADGAVHPDAGANLPVFYGPDRTGTPLVSSSAALVQELGGRSGGPASVISHAIPLNWFPGPHSGLPGIARLLPAQTLRLAPLLRGEAPVAPRRLVDTGLHGGDTETILGELAALLRDGARAAGERFGDLLVPLTAGQDSRLVLAAALASGFRPATYTFHKDLLDHGSAISRSDAVLPPCLARACGLEHLYIRPLGRDAGAAAAFARHTAGRMDDVDRHYIAQGQWDALPRRGVVLRGGMFEIGRRYFEGKLGGVMAGHGGDRAGAVLGAFRLGLYHRDARPLRRALEAWLGTVAAADLPGVDLVDRFYLDQRIGCWLADIEQALDLVAAERVHLANCARVFSLLLSLPEAVRRQGVHQAELVRRLAPDLAAFPVNPPEHAAVRLAQKLAFRLVRLPDLLRARFGRGPLAA